PPPPPPGPAPPPVAAVPEFPPTVEPTCPVHAPSATSANAESFTIALATMSSLSQSGIRFDDPDSRTKALRPRAALAGVCPSAATSVARGADHDRAALYELRTPRRDGVTQSWGRRFAPPARVLICT